MKKTLMLCLTWCLMLSLNTYAKSLQARFSFSTFFAPENGPYVETYLNISGASANYLKLNSGKFQASIQVSIVYSQGEAVKYFDKYNLLSPEIDDSTSTLYNFTDQKRVSLPNGDYTMTMTISDNNSATSKPFQLKQDVHLAYQANVISISDIELLESYQPGNEQNPLFKNGFILEPYVNNYYPKEKSELKFYAEIYNTTSILGNDLFLLNYHIESYETKKILGDFTSTSRQNSKPVNVLLSEFDIANLPSGNYNLIIEIKNRSNELLAVKECFFQRSAGISEILASNGDFRKRDITNTFASQITDKDSLAEYIKCLWPISSPDENTFAMNQLELSDLVVMQQFFFDFWQKRNTENPRLAWTEYKIQVDKVNSFYPALRKKGYMTDRGRVYLQYGPPNTVTESLSEPNTYPYEIWQYYKAKSQSNKKFVFYNPELATNDFKLLHSDANGEVNERQWQLILKKRNTLFNDLDKEKPSNDSFGTHSNDIFTSPK